MRSPEVVGIGGLGHMALQFLNARGRLHFVGATLEPLDINLFPLIMGQRSVSGSPVGSPGTIAKMLDFAALHQIQPVIEKFPMDQVNQAIEQFYCSSS